MHTVDMVAVHYLIRGFHTHDVLRSQPQNPSFIKHITADKVDETERYL